MRKVEPPAHVTARATIASTTPDITRSWRLVKPPLARRSQRSLTRPRREWTRHRTGALPLLVGSHGADKFLAGKVRPVAGQEDQLRIGGLPEQEIGQPLLAAGPDHQVWIGDVGSVEKRSERLRRHILRRDPTDAMAPAAFRNRTRDLVAASIVEAMTRVIDVFVARQVLGFVEKCADIRLQSGSLSDHANPDAVLVELGEVARITASAAP